MGTERKLLVVICLLFTAFAQAETPVDPVLDRLSKVGVFAFGGVGFAGVTSEGEKDYRAIMARPSALATFEQLFATGNAQAKAYALVGIRILDVQRFNELSKPLREVPSTITIQNGCLMSHVLFSAVLKGIDAGNYSDKK